MRTCPVCKLEVEKADALFVDQTVEPQEYYHARCYEDHYGVNVYTKVETGYISTLEPGDVLPVTNSIQGSTRSPWLNTILSKIAQLHDKKNHDYCPDDDNPFFNFEIAEKYSQTSNPQVISNPITSFNILLGIKLARLYALLTRGSQPNNEAFIDSEWDYVVYFLLRESYKLKLEEEGKK